MQNNQYGLKYSEATVHSYGSISLKVIPVMQNYQKFLTFFIKSNINYADVMSAI